MRCKAVLVSGQGALGLEVRHRGRRHEVLGEQHNLVRVAPIAGYAAAAYGSGWVQGQG